MAHKAGRKEESRSRILESAGRGFRAHGFGGLGVDGIAREAGVTSGAFYAHFPSKVAAFRDAVRAGMADLRDGIARFRKASGAGWRTDFIDFYLGERRTCDIREACALQALSGEVMRADRETRQAYEGELREIIALTADGLSTTEPATRRQEAIALLAMLAGGVSIARAVDDPVFSEEIATALRVAAAKLAEPTA